MHYVFLPLFVFALLLCLPSFGIAATPIELKLGHTDPATPEDPYDITARKFGSLIEQYTNGKYKVTVFPNNHKSVLGNSFPQRQGKRNAIELHYGCRPEEHKTPQSFSGDAGFSGRSFHGFPSREILKKVCRRIRLCFP
jgi:hypothetical protein